MMMLVANASEREIELLCKHFIFIYLNDSVAKDVRRATGTMEKRGVRKLFLAASSSYSLACCVYLCFSHASIYVSLMMKVSMTFLCAFECTEEIEKFV